MKFLIKLSLFLGLNHTICAQVKVTQATSTNIISHINSLFGDGIVVTNLKYSDSIAAFGLFDDAASFTGFKSGLLISTGYAKDAEGPNDDNKFGTNFNLPGDLDLNTFTTQPTTDATFIEFDFVPLVDTLKIKFTFASEEYDDAANRIRDMLGVFIKYPGYLGYVNIATLPGFNFISPYTINCGQVNTGLWPQKPPFLNLTNNQCLINDYYRYNPYLSNSFQYNAYLVPITLTIPVSQCLTHSMKLVIADNADGFKDSGIFFEKGTIGTNLIYINNQPALSTSNGCRGNEPFLSVSKPNLSYNWYYNNTWLGSSLNPFKSTLSGVYKVVTTVSGGCTWSDSVQVFIGDAFSADIRPDTFLCEKQFVKLNAIMTPKDSIYSYRWDFNNANNIDTISNPIYYIDSTRTVKLFIKNKGGCSLMVSDTIFMNPVFYKLSPTISDSVICKNFPINISSGLDFSGCRQYHVKDTIYNIITSTSNRNLDFTNSEIQFQIPIGFSFNFYCNNYQNLNISKNGFVSFSSATTNIGELIPSINSPNNFIALAAVPIQTNANSEISYSTLGNIGNRVLIINYFNVTMKNSFGVNSISGQIQLYEKDNHIELHIKNLNNDLPLNVIQGIENADGSLGIATPGRNFSTWNSNFNSVIFRQTTQKYDIKWFKNGKPFASSDTVKNVISSVSSIYKVIIQSETGCSVSDSIKVNVVSKTIEASKDTAICIGDSVHLKVINADIYTWSPNTFLNSSSTSSPISKPKSSISYIITGNYNYPKGCVAFDTVKIIVNELPLINRTADTAICMGNNLIVTFSGGKFWLNNISFPGNNIPLIASKDTVINIKAVDQNLCISYDSIKIKVHPKPKVIATGDTILCAGNSHILNGFGAKKYVWKNNNLTFNTQYSTFDISPSESATYTLTGFNEFNCSSKAFVTIVVNQVESKPPFIQYDNLTICDIENTKSTLIGPEGYTYFWSTNEKSKNITVFQEGKYLLRITDKNKCSLSDSIFIVNECFGIYKLPNIITPNNDGINDKLEIMGLKQNTIVKIYNKWGTLVYETNNYENDWEAQNVVNGVYYFSVINPDTKANINGWVQVIR
ncbi:MAG: choice-of-anchor L domain-containing protein [Bacteroidota bacterium]|nr:choice-of-anchor L domain-containing protein [Bacteroidota bacterium]